MSQTCNLAFSITPVTHVEEWCSTDQDLAQPVYLCHMTALNLMLEQTKRFHPVKEQCLLVFLLIDVESQGIYSQPQRGSLLILNLKVVDSIHLQVLGNL